jgi:Zn finger protein HypA/HybF involved in hydrogenase expression
MITTIEATKLEDGTLAPAHKIEIYCPSCNRDVDKVELAAQKCNDCGADLSTPKQNVAINVTSKPIGTKVWGQ